PPDLYFGEGIGIATNSKGHIFVYTRSGDTRVLEFDQNGAYVREIGQGVHGRRPEPVMGPFDSTLPPAAPEKYKFGRPTDVTWDAQGNIFISDGYVNSRVVKFDKNGRFVKSVGGARGSA